jgi:hypothetical protein
MHLLRDSSIYRPQIFLEEWLLDLDEELSAIERISGVVVRRLSASV